MKDISHAASSSPPPFLARSLDLKSSLHISEEGSGWGLSVNPLDICPYCVLILPPLIHYHEYPFHFQYPLPNMWPYLHQGYCVLSEMREQNGERQNSLELNWLKWFSNFLFSDSIVLKCVCVSLTQQASDENTSGLVIHTRTSTTTQ